MNWDGCVRCFDPSACSQSGCVEAFGAAGIKLFVSAVSVAVRSSLSTVEVIVQVEGVPQLQLLPLGPCYPTALNPLDRVGYVAQAAPVHRFCHSQLCLYFIEALFLDLWHPALTGPGSLARCFIRVCMATHAVALSASLCGSSRIGAGMFALNSVLAWLLNGLG